MKKAFLLLLNVIAIASARGQDGRERFLISWPAEYKWKFFNKATNVEVSPENEKNSGWDWVDLKLIPEGETLNDWTIIGTVSKHTGMGETGVDSLTNGIFSEEKTIFPNAKLTVLEKVGRRVIKNRNLGRQSFPAIALVFNL